jgi:hypothetical protein
LGDQIKGGNAGNSGRLSGTPPTPAGVNRRTAVLFGNKRRPGRPPKIVSREPAPESAVDSAQSSNAAVSSGQAAPSEVDNSSNVNKTSDDIPIKKKRGRKKKSVAESDIEGGFDLGSRWSERAAAVGVTEWGATAAAAGAKSAESSNKSSAPAKESFRLYRDMYDSDAEASHKTDNDEAASSSSAESSGSSQSDDDDDESSSSSDSDNDLSSGKRGQWMLMFSVVGPCRLTSYISKSYDDLLTVGRRHGSYTFVGFMLSTLNVAYIKLTKLLLHFSVVSM